eukprot:1707752-Pleurochrysis_carterae.AAC.2
MQPQLFSAYFASSPIIPALHWGHHPLPPSPAMLAKPALETATLLSGAASERDTVQECSHAPLSSFLNSCASDAALLAAESREDIGEGMQRCELASFDFLSLHIQPVFDMCIERSEPHMGETSSGDLVVRVSGGGVRVNDDWNSRVSIDAINKLVWTRTEDGHYDVHSSINMNISLSIPRLHPMARTAWTAAGRAAVRSACKRTAKKLIRNVRQDYAEWSAASMELDGTQNA